VTLRRVQILVPTGGGGGGEVDRERLIRESLEAVPIPADSALVLARVLQEELVPDPTESIIVAAALIANESVESLSDIPQLETHIFEIAPTSLDSSTIQAGVSEMSPDLSESFQVLAHVSEVPQIPVEAPLLVVGTYEAVPAQLDAVSIQTAINEVAPNPGDSFQIVAHISESSVVPIDSLSLDVDVGPIESVPVASDSVTAIVAISPESIPGQADEVTVNVSGTRPANAATLSTGVTNPNNALDNDADEATVVATASGIGGITATTVNFDFQVNFADFSAALSWLTDITQVRVETAWRASTAGVALGATVAATLAYRLVSGDGWTTVVTKAAVFARIVDQLDILTVVADNWTKMDALQMRANGTITSGTGLGSVNTLGIEFFRVVFAGTRSLA
jgi:hypothetical protein